jgi:hypothetical protein
VIERAFTLFDLLKMMLAAHHAVPDRAPLATVLFAGALRILWTETVIKVEISLLQLAWGELAPTG